MIEPVQGAATKVEIWNAGIAPAIHPLRGVIPHDTIVRIADERSGAVDRVRTLLREILEELGLSRAVIELGLDYDIGTGGRRLSVSQRQQLGLARVLLKRPQLLIVNRGLSALNARNVEKVIGGVLELSRSETDGFGVLWVTATESHSTLFDRILTFDRGALVADEAPNQSRPAA